MNMQIASTDGQSAWARIASRDPAAVDRVYACEQATEILDRTRRIVRRVMPQPRTPHGFYDPEGFIRSSRLSGHRKLFAQSVQRRISAKVHERDAAMTAEEKAALLDSPRSAARSRRY